MNIVEICYARVPGPPPPGGGVGGRRGLRPGGGGLQGAAQAATRTRRADVTTRRGGWSGTGIASTRAAAPTAARNAGAKDRAITDRLAPAEAGGPAAAGGGGRLEVQGADRGERGGVDFAAADGDAVTDAVDGVRTLELKVLGAEKPFAEEIGRRGMEHRGSPRDVAHGDGRVVQRGGAP